MSTLPTGADLIAAERRRQVEVEGWTMEHDRKHGSGAIEQAASCYAGYAAQWPWERAGFKPKGPLHNLVVAGALYQAALDITDPESYHAGVIVGLRDAMAAKIDALLMEAEEVLEDTVPLYVLDLLRTVTTGEPLDFLRHRVPPAVEDALREAFKP